MYLGFKMQTTEAHKLKSQSPSGSSHSLRKEPLFGVYLPSYSHKTNISAS